MTEPGIPRRIQTESAIILNTPVEITLLAAIISKLMIAPTTSITTNIRLNIRLNDPTP